MKNEFPTYPFMGIEPRTQKQQKQLDNLRKKLKIEEPKCDFVLKCILSFDWNRRCIIQSVDEVSKTKSLDMVKFKVNVTAPSMLVDYSVSNPLKEEGWSLKTHEERCWYVYHQLSKYITSRY